jgi:hypothetical protein
MWTAANTSPERIARDADVRSVARATILRLADAANASIKDRRRLRAIVVDDDDAKPANDLAAEDRRERDEGDERHAKDKDGREAVTHDPSPLANGDAQESRFGSSPHRRARQSV